MKKIKEANILVQRSTAEKIVFGIVCAFFCFYAFTLIFPFLWMIVLSFEEPKSLSTMMMLKGAFYIPEVFYFSNYLKAFTAMVDNGVNFIGMIFNSLWFVGIAMVMSVFWHAITAYVFAKFRFKGRNFIYGCAIFSMTVPIVGTGGASYRLIDSLGLYDTGPLYLIATCCGGFGGTFIMMYGIFKNIDWAYAEAVYIDGGGNNTVFFKIMFPQALPALTAMAVNSAIGLWNNYGTPLMYMPSTPTVASGLYKISLYMTDNGRPLYYAGLTISIIPVMVLYGFMSGSMMKNLSIGGLKG